MCQLIDRKDIPSVKNLCNLVHLLKGSILEQVSKELSWNWQIQVYIVNVCQHVQPVVTQTNK